MALLKRQKLAVRILVWAIAVSCFPAHGRAATLATRPASGPDALLITGLPDPDGKKPFDEMTITVRTLNSRPSLRDRYLQIELRVGGYGNPTFAYQQQVKLPQGVTAASVKLGYMQPTWHMYHSIDVLESGRSILQNSTPFAYSSQPAHLTQWCEVKADGALARTGFDFDSMASLVELTNYGLSQAPEDWRVYMGYGGVVWPLALLQSANAAQLQAINDYVLAGGVLIVRIASPDDVTSVDRLLNGLDDSQLPDFRWAPLKDAEPQASVQKRTHGSGHLLAMKQAPSNLHAAVRGFPLYPICDCMRSGEADSEWFWRNLVQSVGGTPVWAFSGLVILFVLTVGPGLLYFTHRLKQRTLILALVPALSLLLTVVVLLYNILREGFDTHGRIVSIEHIDAHTRQGFSWSRQTYFSGSPPKAGLQFPNTAMLKPIDVSEATLRSYQPAQRVSAVLSSDGQSQSVRRWLTARSQQQIFVGHSLSNVDLPLQVQANTAGGVRVKNTSQFPLAVVVLRGAGQECYWTESLPPEGEVDLQPQTLAAVERALQKVKEFSLPQPPENIEVTPSNRWNYWGNQMSIRSLDPLQTFWRNGFAIGPMPEFNYLLLSRHSAHVATPFPASVFRREKNLHVMTGAYRW